MKDNFSQKRLEEKKFKKVDQLSKKNNALVWFKNTFLKKRNHQVAG